MTKDDKILLTQINNYMDSSFVDFSSVRWDAFFSLNRPFTHKSKREVLTIALPQLRGYNIGKARDYEDGTKTRLVQCYVMDTNVLSEKDVEWLIYYLGEKLPSIYVDEFNTREVVYLFTLLIKNHKVSETQFEKIFEPYREDTHGFKENLLDALVKSDNITQNLLEKYVDCFSVGNWQDISRCDLWGMYGINLFTKNNPLSDYLNYHLVLQYNYIPSNILSQLFMGDVLDIKFRLEDGWVDILSTHQFSQYQIDRLLDKYKGSDIEETIYYRILKSQNIEDYILENYKQTFERLDKTKDLYKELTKKRWNHRYLEFKRKKDLKNILKQYGFTILHDELKNNEEYVRCYVCNVYISDTYNNWLWGIEENIWRGLIHEKECFNAPRNTYFKLCTTKPKKVPYAEEVKVYLKDMNIYDKSDRCSVPTNCIYGRTIIKP